MREYRQERETCIGGFACNPEEHRYCGQGNSASPGYQLNAVTVVRDLQWHPEYTLSSVLVLLRLQDTQVEEVLQALIREVDTELQNQSR